jgi:hypothetical protein
MPSQCKSQRQIHSMFDPDPRCYDKLFWGRAIVSHLENRPRARHIQTVVPRSRQPQCQTQPARPARDHSRGRILVQPPVPRHLGHSHHRLQRTEQQAPRLPLSLARDVHAEVEPIYRVNIRVTRRTEQHHVPRRRPSMRVGRRIRRHAVRPQVSLHLDNPSRQHPPRINRNQQLSKQLRRDLFRRILEEGPRHQASRQLHSTTGAHFCFLFQSFSSASTSSA